MFANRYYYEGSHGIVSLLSVSFLRLIYLICPRRINRLVVSHLRERNFPIGRSNCLFFLYVKCSLFLSLSCARAIAFFLSIARSITIRERAYIRFALTVVRQAFLHAKIQNRPTSPSQYGLFSLLF